MEQGLAWAREQGFPEHPVLLGKIGLDCLAAADIPQAGTWLGRVFALKPGYTPNVRDVREILLMMQGALLPTYTAGLLELGRNCRQHGDVFNAGIWFDLTLAADKRCVPAMSAKAEVLLMRDKVEEAFALAEKALALDPSQTLQPAQAPAHMAMGFGLAMRNQFSEALTAHELALSLDPQLAHAHLGWVHAYLGWVHKAGMPPDRIPEAFEHACTLVTLDPGGRHEKVFSTLCRLAGKDSHAEWLRLFPSGTPPSPFSGGVHRAKFGCLGVLILLLLLWWRW